MEGTFHLVFLVQFPQPVDMEDEITLA
jgi:hypothetical protein